MMMVGWNVIWAAATDEAQIVVMGDGEITDSDPLVFMDSEGIPVVFPAAKKRTRAANRFRE